MAAHSEAGHAKAGHPKSGHPRSGPSGARRLYAQLPLGTDPQAIRQRIEGLEKLLERSFRLPVIGNVGLDAAIGLLPVGGDVIAAIMGLYLVWEARNLGMSKWQLARMTARVGLDTLLGAVPVAGDVIDVFYRSNSRNLKAILRHLDRHHPATRVIDAG